MAGPKERRDDGGISFQRRIVRGIMDRKIMTPASPEHFAAAWRKALLDEVLLEVDAVGGTKLSWGEGRIYFNARYYDPSTGRFLTEDPSRKGVNWYAYCENDPINRTDPSGMDAMSAGKDASTAIVLPMKNAQLTWDFQQHVAGKDAALGVDMTSKNPAVTSVHGGMLSYSDSGNRKYGFSAQVSYRSDGKEIVDTYAHLQKPTNAASLVAGKPQQVGAGFQVGKMGNTGYVFTGEGEKAHLVTDSDRALGLGTHLHWDRRVDGVFTDPLLPAR